MGGQGYAPQPAQLRGGRAGGFVVLLAGSSWLALVWVVRLLT